MPSLVTRSQIEKITIDPNVPLLVCDVDEVVVHFIKGLESYLSELSLWLDPSSFALNGNIKSVVDNTPVSTPRVGKILTDFFKLKTHALEPIDGAVEVLNGLSSDMQIVMLSNLPHDAYDARVINLRNLGLNMPLVTNEGGKGPAVKALALTHESDLFFVDDIPTYLTSVGETCPSANLIHFAHDQRFAKHAPTIGFEHFKTRDWWEIKAHIDSHLDKA